MKTGRIIMALALILVVGSVVHAYTWDHIDLENTYGINDINDRFLAPRNIK